MSCAELWYRFYRQKADDLHRIPEHTTVPILGKELWRQQEEQLLQRYIGFVISLLLGVFL
ncbi:hypothetical protein HKD37_12G033808 [Glycine soja]